VFYFYTMAKDFCRQQDWSEELVQDQRPKNGSVHNDGPVLGGNSFKNVRA
jgi:hypothetical protein